MHTVQRSNTMSSCPFQNMLSNKTDYFLRSELWFFSFLLQLPHLSLLSQCTISAALFLPPFSHPLGVTSFLLRTQGQLSHILVINAPSRPQSLCHYGPIVAGNSGHSLRTSNRVRQMRVGGGWGVTKDYKAHCRPLSTSLHTHIGVRAHTHTQPNQRPASKSASLSDAVKNVGPVSVVLYSIPPRTALS